MEPSKRMKDIIDIEDIESFISDLKNTFDTLEKVEPIDSQGFQAKIAKAISALRMKKMSKVKPLPHFIGRMTSEDLKKYLYDMDIHDIIHIIRNFQLDENILQGYIDTYPNLNEYANLGINEQSITPNIIRNNPRLNWNYANIDYSKFTVEEVMAISVLRSFRPNRVLNHTDFTM